MVSSLALLAMSPSRHQNDNAITTAPSKRFLCITTSTVVVTDNTCQYDICSWHKYNLKRKVAELAPVSAQQFAEKLMGKDGVDDMLHVAAAAIVIGLLIH